MMKAWKHKTTGELLDIQTIPNPLPAAGYDPEQWELIEISEAEIAALAAHRQLPGQRQALAAQYVADASGRLDAGELTTRINNDLEVKL